MNKNIGDMTNSELIDFIIDLQEENSRYERKIDKLELIVEQLKISEKARKEAIKYVKKTSGYNNPYNDTFLNTYAVDNLLEILDIDKGE